MTAPLASAKFQDLLEAGDVTDVLAELMKILNFFAQRCEGKTFEVTKALYGIWADGGVGEVHHGFTFEPSQEVRVVRVRDTTRNPMNFEVEVEVLRDQGKKRGLVHIQDFIERTRNPFQAKAHRLLNLYYGETHNEPELPLESIREGKSVTGLLDGEGWGQKFADLYGGKPLRVTGVIYAYIQGEFGPPVEIRPGREIVLSHWDQWSGNFYFTVVGNPHGDHTFYAPGGMVIASTDTPLRAAMLRAYLYTHEPEEPLEGTRFRDLLLEDQSAAILPVDGLADLHRLLYQLIQQYLDEANLRISASYRQLPPTPTRKALRRGRWEVSLRLHPGLVDPILVFRLGDIPPRQIWDLLIEISRKFDLSVEKFTNPDGGWDLELHP